MNISISYCHNKNIIIRLSQLIFKKSSAFLLWFIVLVCITFYAVQFTTLHLSTTSSLLNKCFLASNIHENVLLNSLAINFYPIKQLICRFYLHSIYIEIIYNYLDIVSLFIISFQRLNISYK